MVSRRALRRLAAGFLAASSLMLGRCVAAQGTEAPPATAPADSSALESLENEDAWLETEDDPGLFVPGAGHRAPAQRPVWAGQFLWARGGAQLSTSVVAARGRADLLVAREPGEQHLADDRYAGFSVRPTPWLVVGAGDLSPRVGGGLLLGPRRAGASRAPLRAGSVRDPISLDPVGTSSPARAATAFRGLWLGAERGALEAGVLASSTERNARPSGAAWLPVTGVRHRTAEELARRGRLREQILAIAVAWNGAYGGFGTQESRPRIWALAAVARTDPRRATPLSTSQAALEAAEISTGQSAFEFGLALESRSRLEGTIAFDGRGRTRSRVALESSGAGVRADAAFETEASGFLPLRAFPERRARTRVAVRLFDARPSRARAWAIEGHMVDRARFEPPRVWLAVRLEPRRQLSVELRRDSSPKRTVLAARVSTDKQKRAGCAGSVELRLDPRGLLRETWRVVAFVEPPAALRIECEATLSSGRGSTALLDPDLPGGGVTRWSGGVARTRLEIRRRPGLGHLEWLWPWLRLLRTTSATGAVTEARMGLNWAIGPP